MYMQKKNIEIVWYYDEHCKSIISEVEIIPKKQVIYYKKKNQYFVKQLQF